VLNDRAKDVLYSGPLAVMVDEQSASASEIFAAAIQDYKRGIILGSSSTYGKGTVQRSISLDPESENILFKKQAEGLGDIKLSFRKFYRISGGSTQLKGVTPDIIIPDRLENVKFREKDNPDALSWDEIPKADYTVWNPGYNFSNIVNAANIQLNTSSTFKTMKNDLKLLDNYNDKEYSLNVQKYRAEQKEVRAIAKQVDSLTKLTVNLNITNSAADAAILKTDKDKSNKNSAWLKRIGDDIYIDETVKVVDKMIGEEALAKSK
jgi:carboxyl-terminal processing protease